MSGDPWRSPTLTVHAETTEKLQQKPFAFLTRKAKASAMHRVIFSLGESIYLEIGNSFLGLDIEEGNALLEAFLVGLPGFQQLRFLGAIAAAQGCLHVRILHSRQRMGCKNLHGHNSCSDL